MKKDALGKKGVTATVILVICGVFFFIAFILIATNFANDLFKSFDRTDASLKKLRIAVQSVADNYETGSGKEVVLRMDPDSAIIIINPEHQSETTQSNAVPNQYVLAASAYFSKPSKCLPDSLCICSCNSFDYIKDSNDDRKITCKETLCHNLDNIRIPEKIYLKDVFDYGDNFKYLDNYYLENIFFFPRVDYSLKDDQGRSVMSLMGYFKEIISPEEYISFFLKKESSNPSVVTICMKNKCYEENNALNDLDEDTSCPYNECEEIRDSILCANPKNAEGCEGFSQLCNWNYASSACENKY